jgi:S-adenosylmethionine:tRNA ribosyltransferase-isomerase
MTATMFELPDGLEATAPPTARDGVRLLVAHAGGIEHARFPELGTFLSPGDLVVVNTSGTLAAAVDGTRADGRPVTVHFSTALDDGTWVVEVRPAAEASGPVSDARGGEPITLPDGLRLVLHEPHPTNQTRLWRAGVAVEGGVPAFLARHGRPIRYSYVPRALPLADYQTVFAREPGSAEMPSAGRPFTAELITELVTRGIGVAPITLHTGVSSQDVGEPPQPERFRVPETTARQVNMTRAWGGRVIAVGTTVTRALESAVDGNGVVRERGGWTNLVLDPQHPAQVVGGLVTGWHAPGASHLRLLEAVAGADLVGRAYVEALHARYLWHEFGDSCLLLP